MTLPPGTRVRVVDPQWVREFWGTVADGVPEPVLNALANPGELRYLVRFDEPEQDVSGLGPYRAATIWDRYLRT